MGKIAALALSASTIVVAASANGEISGHPTRNMPCGAEVCTTTEQGVVLNANGLGKMLAAGEGGSITSAKSHSTTVSKWSVHSLQDEMRGTTSDVYAIVSDNLVDFGPRYGKAGMTLYIVNSCCHRKNDYIGRLSDLEFHTYLQIASGQFFCSGKKPVSLKFDRRPIQEYGCSSSPDGRSDVIRIEGDSLGKEITDGLSKASTLIIEAPFFQHGSQQFHFHVAGFDEARRVTGTEGDKKGK